MRPSACGWVAMPAGLSTTMYPGASATIQAGSKGAATRPQSSRSSLGRSADGVPVLTTQSCDAARVAAM